MLDEIYQQNASVKDEQVKRERSKIETTEEHGLLLLNLREPRRKLIKKADDA